ncbi:trypsin-like serine peptidase [Oceanibaculum pacificum]|uniref:Peptidase S1 domain-containing protein n=1 Tax=Oceanibaculum pacificum TaxID=580166 RepID=A0A154W6A9_9PROT|nr:trypsin-like peptidase domain-containing protein [Oceanibaculum pacificum]KZD09072.1 hypothetical protein AUP43_07660 [Oceanibaculum pacificum]
MRRSLAALLICLAALAATAARAEELPRSTLVFGADDRRMAGDLPAAIGRLNVAGFAKRTQCSGTLIAPDIVATAAHCVLDRATGKPVAAARLHFLAGLGPDGHEAHGQGRCIRLPDDKADVALVRLARALPIKPIALLHTPLAAGDAVTHAGYALDRPYAVSAHRDCHVLRPQGGMLLTDCDTNHGQSGGPLLARRDGTDFLAGIMVGVAPGKYSAAVSVPAWKAMLETPVCPR